jgi:hypothetical protein
MESFNGQIKLLIPHAVSMGCFLTDSVNKMFKALAITSVQSERHIVDGTHAVEFLSNHCLTCKSPIIESSKILVTSDDQVLKHQGRYYVNSNTIAPKVPVSIERISNFLQLEEKNLPDSASLELIGTTLKDYQARYCSLHIVMQEDPLDQASFYKCDCNYYQNYGIICRHIIAVLSFNKQYDFNTFYGGIEGQRKRGRKRKHSPALQKD